MKFYNLNYQEENINFCQALKKGLGKNQGLFFPVNIPKLNNKTIQNILNLNFIDRSSYIISLFLDEKEISINDLKSQITKAFNFPLVLNLIDKNIACLELFYGPTLAFKDFGVRFMAQMLNFFDKKKIIILTATSGDTGAAVAHAFHKMNNIEVVILYPYKKISILQEKLFCTLGNNIKTIAIKGNFDDCQKLIKKIFNDKELQKLFYLNSANSINISRLIAQICYYFEAFAQIPLNERKKKIIFSVPSGNFGNLTAGLIAKTIGLPINKFIAATNINDTVPRFLNKGYWKPRKTIETLSNAMDVSIPNNWPRIIEIFNKNNWNLNELESCAITDIQTTKTTVDFFKKYKYILEPHSSVSFCALKKYILNNETFNVFLGTAHPAKFQNYVYNTLYHKILLPKILINCIEKKNLSYILSNNFNHLKNFLIKNYVI
ncbi:threonine synthase [Enterobacteriaceae endosymbiont of Donacia bicoloricornis]|uniref:threonine synthase n=1 Tax=Enterobacteriaceae endosymbiont of Donacia bicoloricornis TaxID=2675772 RepID=UPI001449A9B5|nr:threonine synthase [Enterobacteriaceae endosymbiont of Donacia bicoloricornis]QJC37883.1 threonine synthase [Enterobacteriaceae endosymbiont of Donacia bicoloricornis]